jgi:hypothetical protein
MIIVSLSGFASPDYTATMREQITDQCKKVTGLEEDRIVVQFVSADTNVVVVHVVHSQMVQRVDRLERPIMDLMVASAKKLGFVRVCYFTTEAQTTKCRWIQ